MTHDSYRLKYHLEPPTGWLNDPNGLCQKDLVYHVFFQYVPEDALGSGKKKWGHYISKDLITWSFEGVSLSPDQPYDQDGVYSGSALADDQGIHLFYTGNVKQPGNYDYILKGREANQVLATLKDGQNVPESKMLLLTNQDYPLDYTCHVRDPKVWKEGSRYYMILGGRKKGDQGAALVYESPDMRSWKLVKELKSRKAFGYMWECPDYLDFKDSQYLSICPQGLIREEERFQNRYQSGYLPLDRPIGEVSWINTEDFVEWDMGFDFYAPQTFVDEGGRRILMGWMGLPDILEEYSNPTTAHGWQHCLTLPREITVKNNRLLQNPVEELKKLRKEKHQVQERILMPGHTFELLAGEIQNKNCSIAFGNDLVFGFKNELFTMEFPGKAGAGRKKRCARLKELHEIRILTDTSSVEVFLNGGETVLSTRWYPASEKTEVTAQLNGSPANIWEI